MAGPGGGTLRQLGYLLSIIGGALVAIGGLLTVLLVVLHAVVGTPLTGRYGPIVTLIGGVILGLLGIVFGMVVFGLGWAARGTRVSGLWGALVVVFSILGAVSLDPVAYLGAIFGVIGGLALIVASLGIDWGTPGTARACLGCGTVNPATSKFCSGCGKPLP